MITAATSILGEPVPKERPRIGKNGNVYTPSKTKAYERAVALIARTKLPRFKEADRLIVNLTFYCATAKTKDLDNLCKSTLDGLQKGGTFKNDSQIVELHAKKVVSFTETPRTEIEVVTLAG